MILVVGLGCQRGCEVHSLLALLDSALVEAGIDRSRVTALASIDHKREEPGLLALAQVGLVPVSAGLHALAVGATGGLIIGMITRTARGHTGRPLKASKYEVTAYALVMAAAVLRVLLPLVSPELLSVSLVGAGLAWTAAFTIYLVIYTPWLMQSRLDGQDG